MERQQPIDVEVEEYRRDVAAIQAAQEAGHVRADIPAIELMAMVIALVISWAAVAGLIQPAAPS